MNASASNMVRLMNPLGLCQEVEQTPLARRLETLNGKSIGFIDNFKPNVGPFLKYIEEMIRADYTGVQTHAVRKHAFSSFLIANELEGKVHAVVNAWGD